MPRTASLFSGNADSIRANQFALRPTLRYDTLDGLDEAMTAPLSGPEVRRTPMPSTRQLFARLSPNYMPGCRDQEEDDDEDDDFLEDDEGDEDGEDGEDDDDQDDEDLDDDDELDDDDDDL